MQLTREDWVQAGVRTLAEAGVHAVRVEALARVLRISKGSFYHHFRDRQELLDSIMDHWEENATQRIIRSSEQDQITLEQLLHISMDSDKRLEKAIYAWAKDDPALAARLAGIEEQRIRYVAILYQRKGLQASEAIERARLTYMAYVGWMVRFESNTDWDAKRLLLILSKI